jgi:hypothetical protein
MEDITVNSPIQSVTLTSDKTLEHMLFDVAVTLTGYVLI